MANILVVDDDKDILLVVQKLLKDKGHEVTCCLDPLDALDKWNQEAFDVVLSDANMPHVNGFDLVKTLSQNARGLGTSLALLTARRDKKDIKRAMESGADDYIVKPIDPDLFISKVESLINKKADFKTEINFANTPVRFSADWQISSEIVSLSEQGMTVFSPIQGVKGSKIKIQSDLFKLIGIEAPWLRVIDCKQDPEGSMKFYTQTTFIGLSDNELQKIRFWINANLGPYKRKKGAA